MTRSSQITRPASRSGSTADSSAVRSRSERYGSTAVVRSRNGGFDAGSDTKASSDRASAGSVRMRSGAAASTAARVKGGGVTTSRVAVDRNSNDFGYAHTDLVRNNYRFVSRTRNNTYIVNRTYLIDNGGRWGHAPTRYTGRNYHFYLTIYNQGYFGFGMSCWGRRYYGDSWDVYFGWSPATYIVPGWYSSGIYYFEPCYAFSFTFNHGYESGYIDGFRRGTQDWNYGYPYYSWAQGYSGYDLRWGPVDEFRDGYEQGFRQGYYAGYSGLVYGYDNFGYGDFRNYPVVYDFDYDYYDNISAYGDDYIYEDGYSDGDYYYEY